MTESAGNSGSGIPRRWVELAVIAGCVILLLAVCVPAIHNARSAARKTQSKNNLKQIGLALHNYHDVWNSFPLGTTQNSDGKPLHGWLTMIHPYMLSSPLYSMVFQNRRWDHPINEHLFRPPMDFLLIPGADESPTADGFSVTHYMGNPNILHRVSTVSLSNLPEGLSNNWLAGEVSGNYQPWGYQFNWRPISLPFNSGDGSFGRPTGDGVQICLADMSVRFLVNEVDSQIVNSLANAEPVADIQLTQVPNRTPVPGRGPDAVFRSVEVLLVERQEPYGNDLKANVSIDKHDNADAISFSTGSKGGRPQLTSEHVAMLQKDYPTAKRLYAREWSVTGSDVGILTEFAQLETLIVNKLEISNDATKQLRSLGQLKYLVGFATDQQQAAIAEILPDVEFTNRR